MNRRRNRLNPNTWDCRIDYDQMEDFLNYLVDQGADVFSESRMDFDTHIKFIISGRIGIVLWNCKGNYLAHEYLTKWRDECRL